MLEKGAVTTTIRDGVGWMEFYHPKKNSLPGVLLAEIAAEMTKLGELPEVRVIVLASRGDGPFCAGASFDELVAVDSPARGKEFFLGFARLILAMRACPKFVVARVQGKAVGGGVGLVAAADYTLAVRNASIRLSELALGIGPFVVGPCVERKIGFSAFSAMSIDADWRDGEWARDYGLYTDIYSSVEDLDQALTRLIKTLAAGSPEAMAQLKAVFWEGTGDWPALLEERAAISGRLVLSEFTKQAIAAFKAR